MNGTINVPLLLVEVGGLLFVLSVLSRVARRFAISPIPLYLLLGLAFGRGGLVELEASEEFFEVGAQIGVILLLVMLGLEYTASELVGNLRRHTLGGLVDAVLNAVPGAAFALLLGWGPVAALAVAGITWISSSGVIAKTLTDLHRIGNRETPTIISLLVIEDLAMAFYLPVLAAVAVGTGFLSGAATLSAALAVVVGVLVVALRFGNLVSPLVDARDAEALLLGVLGLTFLVAGLAEQLHLSAAVGAFLIGIAISGPVADHAAQLLSPLRDLFAAVFFIFFGLATVPANIPPVLLPAFGLAVLTMVTKIGTGWYAARREGIGRLGRWRAGFTLVPRGEFSIVIAGLAVGAGIEPQLAPFATAYVLITVVTGPLLARLPDSRWFKTEVAVRSA